MRARYPPDNRVSETIFSGPSAPVCAFWALQALLQIGQILSVVVVVVVVSKAQLFCKPFLSTFDSDCGRHGSFRPAEKGDRGTVSASK